MRAVADIFPVPTIVVRGAALDAYLSTTLFGISWCPLFLSVYDPNGDPDGRAKQNREDEREAESNVPRMKLRLAHGGTGQYAKGEDDGGAQMDSSVDLLCSCHLALLPFPNVTVQGTRHLVEGTLEPIESPLSPF